MTRHKRTGIDDALAEKGTDLVALAREAASKDLPAADTDAAYYLGLAEKQGAHIDSATRASVWDAFHAAMPERMKRVEEAIARYEKSSTPDAAAQKAFYEKHLKRLKSWTKP